MSSYRKSMSEVYNNMYLSEDNVAVLRNIVKNKQMQPVKFSDGKMKVDLFTASAVTQALDKVNDKNREKITKLINTGKKSAFASIAKVVMKSENDPEIEEAVSMAQQAAIAISKKERGNKPKKEEVELDELMPATKHVAKSKKNPDMFCVFDKDGNEVKLFKDKKDAEEYAVKNHDALNEEEVDLDEEWKVGDKASYMGKSVKVTKVYRNGGYQIDGKTNVSGNQLRIEEVDLDEAVKVGDNIKVKLRRKGREYIEKGEVIKIEGDKITVKHDFSRTPSGVKMTDIVKEEVELDENFKKMSNDKLKAWLSKNDTEDSVSPVFGNQLKLAKRELISRGLKMKEEVDLDEGLVKKGIDLENAAKRSKNPVESDGSDKNDKKDMLKVAAMLKKGDRSGVVKFAKTLDDDRRLQTFGISLSPQEYVEDLLEEVDLDEASARADAMRAMRKGKTVDPADIDTDASDDDVKSASKNIIMQLRKSVSLRGNFPVEFTDKKKVKVSAKIAQAVQNKHNSMKKANDKEKFQAKVSKSYKDMLSALKENTILDKVSKKLKEIKNG